MNKDYYHGTSRQAGLNIMKCGFIESRDPEWLGDGVYFFEDDDQMALDWGQYICYKFNYDEYIVLKCRVDLKSGEDETKAGDIFDLTQDTYRTIFHKFRDNLFEKAKKGNIHFTIERRDFKDGKLINEICKEIYPFKAVRQLLFIKINRDKIHKLSSRVPNCTVLVVRDLKCIKSIEIHMEGGL